MLRSFKPDRSAQVRQGGLIGLVSKGERMIQTETLTDNSGGTWYWYTGEKGWICPKCGKVYAPHVDECSDCNNNWIKPNPYPWTPEPSPYVPTNPWENPWVGTVDPNITVTFAGEGGSITMRNRYEEEGS